MVLRGALCARSLVGVLRRVAVVRRLHLNDVRLEVVDAQLERHIVVERDAECAGGS